jgi:uncharacterized membrane protein YdfJ with MMPL/SSD domain
LFAATRILSTRLQNNQSDRASLLLVKQLEELLTLQKLADFQSQITNQGTGIITFYRNILDDLTATFTSVDQDNVFN